MSTTKKRKWSDWVVDYILNPADPKKPLCPGDVPSMGKADDLMTKAEFQLTLPSLSAMHSADNCHHFMDERLGLSQEGMELVPSANASGVTEGDVQRGRDRLKGSDNSPSSVVDRFKRDLHTSVDLIELRSGGKLYIPEQLLKLDTFLKNFFEV